MPVRKNICPGAREIGAPSSKYPIYVYSAWLSATRDREQIMAARKIIVVTAVAGSLALLGGAGYVYLANNDATGNGGSTATQDYIIEIPARMLADDGSGLVLPEVGVVVPERSGEDGDTAIQTWFGTEDNYTTIRDLRIVDRLTVTDGGTERIVTAKEGETFYVIVSDPLESGSTGGVVTVDGSIVTSLPAEGGSTVVMAATDAVVGLQGATGGIGDIRAAIEQNGSSPLDDVKQLPEPSSAYAASPAEAVQRFILAIQAQDYYAACALMSPAAVVDIEGNAGTCGEGGLQGALAWKNYTSEYAWLLNEDGAGFSYVGGVNNPMYVTVHRLAGAAEVGIRTVGNAEGYQVDVLDYQDSF